MKNNNELVFDRLIKGINSIISENRSSLLDSEICLLEECVFTLKMLSIEKVKKKRIDLMINVCGILLKFFNSDFFDNIKHLL